MSDLHDAVLQHVNNPGYKPVKAAVIAKRLGLLGDAAKEVSRVCKQLIKSGDLSYGPSHRLMPAKTATNKQPKPKPQPIPKTNTAKRKIIAPEENSITHKDKSKSKTSTTGRTPRAEQTKTTKTKAVKNKDGGSSGEKTSRSSNHFTGTFRRTSGGYGFVRPEGTARAEGRDADVFIPANGAGDAASGDVVSVRLESKRGYKGKQEGRIIDVIERATNRFVGLYFEKADQGLVQVDGKLFTDAIYVGDPGAKGARPDDKVVIDMVRFPSHVRDGEAVIVDVLGQRGMPGVDTMSIIHEFNLPGEFGQDVIENARLQAEKFDESIPRTRRDLTSETIITIDPADARDFDDAISLERLDNGHWLLGVHIADVSHFVRPKTPLDREAHDRATSVYLPDRVIPMLPEIISNNLASLQPDKVRYAISAMIEMTEDGVRVATDVFKSAIKSCRRFTYEEVDDFLANRKAWEKKLSAPVHDLLGRMHKLAMTLRRRRFERGSLELSMPEMKIELDADGRVSGAHLEQNTESHQMIEEFMLAANVAVAERLADEGLFFLRRVHGSPDPRKLRQLTEFVRELGIEVDSLESRFELQRLLGEVQGETYQHAVNYAVLRSMQRAVYSPEEDGHYALASDCYCHFTSPIRRYPDLTIHRMIESLNRGRRPKQEMEETLILGDHCSEREQRATAAERELNKVKLLHYLADKIGMKLDGIITGVESFGLFVTGVELPAEGMVHISSLTDDYYKFDRAGHVISGFRTGNTFRLGDPVKISVASVDIDARELDFRLLSHSGGKKTKGGKGKPGRSAKSHAKKPKSASKGKKTGKGKRAKPKRDKRRR